MKLFSKILFFTLMVLLFIPIIQQFTHYYEIEELNGSIKKTELPTLNSESWFSESFQSQFETYLSQEFGFANSFIRFQNQLQFYLFKVARANGVVVGKENYLYERSYIDAYYGNDFLGKEVIENQFAKLKKLQDTLLFYEVELLIVYAPGKASFYPEFIPDNLREVRKITNLEYSLKMADSFDIDYIDMSKWFISMKDTSRFCLYPKTGIHYSFYGARLVVDTIVNFCRVNYGFNLTEIGWSEIKLSDKLKKTDKDIERGMNLISEIDNFEMPYQNIKIGKRNESAPKMIVIADSYYWQLHNMGVTTKIFKHGEFWFYNKQVYPKRNKKDTWVRDLNLKKEILSQDLIMLFTTEPVLKRQYWSFIDKAYDAFFNPKKDTYKEKIEEQANKIRKNKKLMKSIEEKAVIRNISIDSMLMLDAEYIIKLNAKK